MKKWNYYNDTDPFVCAWARELIKAGLVPDGEVDCRSIEDVRPDELFGFVQCHFFCGILGWAHALRLAGWPADRPVWSGSCPCQPFSQAGKGAGFADSRHLWPTWYNLIRECRPPVIFGEQVASPDGLGWLDLVQADLEEADYACGAVDYCAAGVGAPHIRQRLWWVADSNTARRGARREGSPPVGHGKTAESGSGVGRVGNNNNNKGLEGRALRQGQRGGERSPWAASVPILCRDGRTRPIEPGVSPLAHGVPSRVGQLRGYGNAIVPQVAARFIEAYLTQ